MNGKVAPHENKEVQLVLGDSKPLAVIEQKKQPGAYALAASLGKAGSLVTRTQPTVDSPKGEIVFTKPKNKHLIAEYTDLLLNGVSKYGIREYHRKMGRLFGYSAEDIEKFIIDNINCNCSKCKGRV